jgi:hypothetical protein
MQHSKKRFTDTKKWEKEWFLSLSLEDKLVWLYLLDTCDECGLWNVNWRLCSVLTGVDLQSAPDSMQHQLIKTNHEKVLCIKDFMPFQYGLEYLEKKSPMITKCVRKLIGYGIIEQSDFDTAQAQNEGEARVSTTLQEKEKVEVKVKEDKKSLNSITKEYRKELQYKYLDVDVELEFERFKNWLASKGKRFKDYRAGFRNWLVSPYVEKTDKMKQKIKEEKQLKEQIENRERDKNRDPKEFAPPPEFLDFVKNFKNRTHKQEENDGQET